MTLLLLVPLGLAIGVALGALGGGGSILAVPALVYGVGLGTKQAMTTSLVVVGVTALGAMAGHWRAGHVRLGVGLWFGLAGIAGSVAGSMLNHHVDTAVLLVSFAVVMLVVAWRMWVRASGPGPADDDRGGRRTAAPPVAPSAAATPLPVSGAVLADMRPPGSRARLHVSARLAVGVAAAGTVVGFLTGFFGVGGGFVIVPALVLVLGFDMPVAVGTSLLVIAVNAAVALITRLATTGVDWHVALPFTVAGLAGALAGTRVADRVSSSTLVRCFAVLLGAVASYTMVRTVVG
ncbi:MAG TPA: sulfite exporter TauE/SafE family protein [Acidimicrobiales bacterium]|nr:sulfite exporter TauE/SafE family protein [Acidimicrobiales bacterium]